MKKVTLVDIHGSIIDAARKNNWNINLCAYTSINQIKYEPGNAYVSPANSKLIMDGGIDYMLSRIMFPSVEKKAQDIVRELGFKTLSGKYYLPIGKAIVVPTHIDDIYLLAAPTMWLPQEVRGTHNPYHAAYAIFKTGFEDERIKHIIIPGLCTGCGEISPDEAVQQMKEAYFDVLNNKKPRWSQEEICQEQPNILKNNDFKNKIIE